MYVFDGGMGGAGRVDSVRHRSFLREQEGRLGREGADRDVPDQRVDAGPVLGRHLRLHPDRAGLDGRARRREHDREERVLTAHGGVVHLVVHLQTPRPGRVRVRLEDPLAVASEQLLALVDLHHDRGRQQPLHEDGRVRDLAPRDRVDALRTEEVARVVGVLRGERDHDRRLHEPGAVELELPARLVPEARQLLVDPVHVGQLGVGEGARFDDGATLQGTLLGSNRTNASTKLAVTGVFTRSFFILHY